MIVGALQLQLLLQPVCVGLLRDEMSMDVESLGSWHVSVAKGLYLPAVVAIFFVLLERIGICLPGGHSV